jgi:hypothetical protein
MRRLPTAIESSSGQVYIPPARADKTEAVCGFALSLLGGSRNQALPFFFGAAVLFALGYPRLPTQPAAAMPIPPA